MYDDSKSGGTRKFTQVRKIIGNKQDFKKDVIEELGFKMEDVVINPVTLHLIIKVSNRTPIIRRPAAVTRRTVTLLTFSYRAITLTRSSSGCKRGVSRSITKT